MKKIFIISASVLYSFIGYGQILLDSTYIKVTPVVNIKNYPVQIPWEIVWAPDNFIWMTMFGSVYKINPQTGNQQEILFINDYARPFGNRNNVGSKQMGLAIHPEFNTNHFIYVDYNYVGEAYNYADTIYDLYMKIVRYTYNSGSGILENPFIIFDGIKILDGYHDGGKMIISNDHIFITIGDAKQAQTNKEQAVRKPGIVPQNLDEFNGKILRLNLDGSVPEDNPFATAPFAKTPRNLIWSYGHRNTQGLVVGNGNKLYYAEHGRNNDDEFGIIEKGKNYGWPFIEGFCDSLHEVVSCDTVRNHVEPLVAWNPNVAPSDMEYVGDSQISEFKNSILVGTLTGDGYGNHIAVLSLNETGDRVISERAILSYQYGRIRDLCVSPEGDIYFVTSNFGEDKVMKISFDSKRLISEVENSIDSEVFLYPNPTGIERKIHFKLPTNKGVLKIYNGNGNIIHTYLVTEKEMIIEASIYASGIYLLHYINGMKTTAKKIIIE